MIRLRTLGTLDLTADDPDPALRRLVGQPKRIALLTYLTLQAPKRPARRDTLLGLFWPELAQDKARHALSQALYVLRQSLGEVLVEQAGQDTIEVNPALISSDVAEFVALLERGDREKALELYGGDLLDGFYLSDAPEFERWLDDERANLRQRAVDATRAMAQSEEAAGNLPGAARWARSLIRLTPFDEPNLISLMELLARAGDRSGAHQEYRLFRDRLRSELEIEPSERVEHALAAIDRTPTRRPAASTALPSPAPESSGDRATDAGAGTAPRPQPKGRRWRIPVILAAVSLLAVIAFSRPLGIASTFLPGEQEKPRVLVTALTNRTDDPAMAALGRLASDWLSSEIARTGLASVVPPAYALQLVRSVEGANDRDEDEPTLARMLVVASRTKVDLVLGGRIAGTGDSAAMEVFALDPASGEYAFVLQPVPVAVAAPEAALEHLREATIVALAEHGDDRLREWSTHASHPPSYAAYRQYAAAIDAFSEAIRPAQAREAAELFIDAWRHDTAFTAPLIWGVYAFLNGNDVDRADSLAHTLEPNLEALAEWDRRMLLHLLADMHGDLGATYHTAAAVVELAPDSEWQYKLARAAMLVGCRDLALSLLQALDPNEGWLGRSAQAYWTLRMDLRHLNGDAASETRDAESAQRQLTDALHPGQGYRAVAAKIRAAARGENQQELARLLGEARALGTGGTHSVYLKLLYWGPFDLSATSPAHQMILDSAWAWYADRGAAGSCPYRNVRFVLLYRSGRWQEAEDALRQLSETGCLTYPAYGAYQAVLAARRGDAARAQAVIDSFPWEEGYGHYGHVAIGDESFWRARVDAILGRPADAVAHLRRANAAGVPYEAVFEGPARIDFDGIWEYRPLQQLLVGRQCVEG